MLDAPEIKRCPKVPGLPARGAPVDRAALYDPDLSFADFSDQKTAGDWGAGLGKQFTTAPTGNVLELISSERD